MLFTMRRTLRALFLQPGLLTLEFIRDRRAGEPLH